MKRETHAATIDDNPHPCLPLPLPPPHGILGLRKWVLGLRRGESKPKNQSEREKRSKTERERERELNDNMRVYHSTTMQFYM